jgi:hypothetical protein
MSNRINAYLKLTDTDTCKAIRDKELSFNLNIFLNSETENGLQIRIINNDSIVVLTKQKFIIRCILHFGSVLNWLFSTIKSHRQNFVLAFST